MAASDTRASDRLLGYQRAADSSSPGSSRHRQQIQFHTLAALGIQSHEVVNEADDLAVGHCHICQSVIKDSQYARTAGVNRDRKHIGGNAGDRRSIFRLCLANSHAH